MNRILVLSRTEAEHLDLSVPYAVVSLTDPGDDAKIKQRWGLHGIVREEFHDLEPAPDGWDCLVGTLMVPEQARRIAAFIRRIADDIDTLVVHCFAGASRSISVAMAITDTLGLGREMIQWGSDPHVDPPNHHVYRLMCEALTQCT